LNPEELKDLIEGLNQKLSSDNRNELNAKLNNLQSAFPFNFYEFNLMYLLDKGAITFDYYENLRAEYVTANKHLELFSLAPRIFGEIWGQNHLMELDERFEKPSSDLDSEYEGQYDLWFEGIKVEVKASRSINTKVRGNLVSKALRFDDNKPFWMNYQQLKLDIADVFIFIGVWVDEIKYWVMSNDEIKNSPHISHQHRGGIEYQIGITHKNISDFDEYLVSPDELGETILAKTN